MCVPIANQAATDASPRPCFRVAFRYEWGDSNSIKAAASKERLCRWTHDWAAGLIKWSTRTETQRCDRRHARRYEQVPYLETFVVCGRRRMGPSRGRRILLFSKDACKWDNETRAARGTPARLRWPCECCVFSAAAMICPSRKKKKKQEEKPADGGQQAQNTRPPLLVGVGKRNPLPHRPIFRELCFFLFVKRALPYKVVLRFGVLFNFSFLFFIS